MPKKRKHEEKHSRHKKRKNDSSSKKQRRPANSDYSSSARMSRRPSSVSRRPSPGRTRSSHVRHHISRRPGKSVRHRSRRWQTLARSREWLTPSKQFYSSEVQRRRKWTHRQLLLSPLTAVVREKHLLEIFKRFGSIEDVRIMKNSHGNYKMAIIRFRHSMNALEAVRFMDCGMIDNLVVNVEPLETRRRHEHRTKRDYHYR
ncbi:hypothetical protein M514_11105, partial [Trichuris suis]